jgi:hypothetical protein
VFLSSFRLDRFALRWNGLKKKKKIIRDRELFGIICHLLVCKCCWPALSFFISFFFFIDFGLLFASFFYSFCWASIWQRNTSR